MASFDIINSTDNQGNTALHVAAYRGQLAVVEALILASPSSISLRNNAGETFLHMAVSGFQTPGFRRLDRQVELMKKLVTGKVFNMEEVINAKNNDGRTALHMAIIGNIHSDLVEHLMTARSIDVNIRDDDGMTPLDLLRQGPRSASSEILIRQLISAGGIFSCRDYTARRAIASHLKMQGTGGSSPGTSFRISDTEIFLYTGIENESDASMDQGSGGLSSYSTDMSPFEPATENPKSSTYKKASTVNYAAQRLKSLIHWRRAKEKKPERLKKMGDDNSMESCKKGSNSDEQTPTSLRQRFSKPPALSNNKRTLAVRSNLASPVAKKRFASGLKHGIMQSLPHITIPGRSHSSSFSKSSISSPSSLDKQKGVYIESDPGRPSCSNQIFDNGTPNSTHKPGSAHKRQMNQYFCFGASGLSAKNPVSRQQHDQTYKRSILSAA